MTHASERPRIAVILAAGQGKRMRSALPKVLHRAAGLPLLAWAIEAARGAGCRRIFVVVGHGAERVRAEVAAGDLTWVLQAEQRGTGHALAQVEAALRDAVAEMAEDPGVAGGWPHGFARPAPLGPLAPDAAERGLGAQLLVLSGDVPLVTPATLERLADAAAAGWGAMAVAELERPSQPEGPAGSDGPGAAAGLGRVVVGSGGLLERIVEAADASPEELALRTVNAGIYALPAPEIFAYLERLEPANAQGELYLTDALGAAAADGRPVRLVPVADPLEALGVNTRAELARVHRRLLDRHVAALLDSGVTVLEPARTVIEATVCVGADTVIHPGVCLLGRTDVGAGCTLHQGAWLRDTRLGDGVEIEPYSVLDGAEVEAGCRVGPFARLRPASHLLRGARVGNFVEVKGSRLGEGSRVGHLAYVGDAEIGARANLGAGTVTCNFDGTAKHRTEIGSDAFVGSDTILVAPVRVGDGASTAAGSVVTRDVPDGALAVGRARQKNLPGRASGLAGRLHGKLRGKPREER
jgi:bifunctional UDP-N-acetylglucosamine pyrophosphorylase/glucosamine-1-phosphate N-acetyltransferase